ncbi:MAG TPA: hypothetical protein K8V11_07440 [Dietzia timorensis]|uniref:Uncharacterized protein n=1 Tax=Dietzia timorensis TaxID=499555 RepID=A0A921F378_9ACTN|nr:hypothetical protein [Dietzia timorensis]HJE90826.1 hypothetical protein [Dietzia timorensis]
MRHSPGPTRRELFKLVGLAAGLAVVGGSVAACGELDSEQQNRLVDSWRASRSDIALAESAREQFDPESAEFGALDRVIEARTVHRDSLVEALEAAGEELPTEDSEVSEGTGDSAPTPEAVEPATLDRVVEALTASGRTAREAAAILEGYPSALAGSVGAACSALAQVSLGVALGRSR